VYPILTTRKPNAVEQKQLTRFTYTNASFTDITNTFPAFFSFDDWIYPGTCVAVQEGENAAGTPKRELKILLPCDSPQGGGSKSI
jgi:hypothetical protein